MSQLGLDLVTYDLAIKLPGLKNRPVGFKPRPHPGFVQELTDNGGTVQSSYAYDSFSRSVKLQENVASDYQYAGYFNHARSGLYLAAFRLYRPALGRWINRDPMKEDVSLNLYAYVENRPSFDFDPLGPVDSVSASLARGIASGNPEEVQLILDVGEGVLSKAQVEAGKAAIAKLNSTADQIICQSLKGSVRKQFPKQFLDKTLKEIIKLANDDDKADQTAKKLLTDIGSRSEEICGSQQSCSFSY